MSEKFFERYIDNLNWESICRNNNISIQFILKYAVVVPDIIYKFNLDSVKNKYKNNGWMKLEFEWK